jgi:hypothetical protein
LFSLSLRVTGHPCIFHHTRVRPSTQFYLSFSLPVTRSPGFGSTTCNFRQLASTLALFRLGFPPAPALLSLNLAAYRNSQAHSTKGTLSPSLRRALACCRSMVSGSISLPSPGFFSPFPHGTCSLSVALWYLVLDRGRPSFRQGSSSLAVLRFRAHEVKSASGTGLSPSLTALPSGVPLTASLLSSRDVVHPPRATLQPPRRNGVRLDTSSGLDPSPFARRYLGNHSPACADALFSFPPGTEMVQFPGYRFMRLCIQRMMTESLPPGYPIRLSADLRMCAPPRSFSQLTTAFIAPELHRHPPWTYIRLAILLITLPSRTFSRPRYLSNIAFFSHLLAWA